MCRSWLGIPARGCPRGSEESGTPARNSAGIPVCRNSAQEYHGFQKQEFEIPACAPGIPASSNESLVTSDCTI
jgi:hypothetical protein